MSKPDRGPGAGLSTPDDSLRTRAAAALLLGGLALGAVVAGPLAWAILVTILAVAAGQEYLRLTGLAGRPLMRPYNAAAMAAAAGFSHAGQPESAGLALLAMASLAAAALGERRASLWSLLGIVYIGVAVIALIWLRHEPQGLALIATVLAGVWAADTAAFAIGRAVGGPPLPGRLSPRKTWSGLSAGLVAGTLAAFGVGLWLGLGAIGLIVTAPAIAIAAMTGDIAESALKRHFQVKDAGESLPGHGGLLDRLDSLLLAGPVAAIIVVLTT